MITSNLISAEEFHRRDAKIAKKKNHRGTKNTEKITTVDILSTFNLQLSTFYFADFAVYCFL